MFQSLIQYLALTIINPFLFANEHTEMKLKIYLSEAWMCSEFGMLITDVERERVKILSTSIALLEQTYGHNCKNARLNVAIRMFFFRFFKDPLV